MNDPGLGGYDAVTDDAALGYGDEAVRSGRAATRVAQVDQAKKPKPARARSEPRKPKSTWKSEANGPHEPVKTIYILYYFSDALLDRLQQRLHGTSDLTRYTETSKFFAAGITIIVRQESEKVWSDLGDALHEPGAIVVHLSHSLRDKDSTRAKMLRPRPDPDDASADITFTQLKAILKTMNAKAFIVAACATDGCIGKVARDTALIVTDSGKNLTTNTVYWSDAIVALLMKVVDGKSLQEALTAGNTVFAGIDKDDRFVLVSGKPSMTWMT